MVTSDDPQTSEVDPAPQQHRFHPEPSSAPRDEANMQLQASTWMTQSRAMESAPCISVDVFPDIQCQHQLNILMLKHKRAFLLPRCDQVHLICLSPGDSRRRVKDVLCHWPVTDHVRRILSCQDYYLRCSLSRTASAHSPFPGLDYSQSEQAACS